MVKKHMTTGVTLGKYAPLHKGHEYVIATALQEMEHVIVIVYNASEVTAIPTSVRAAWIQEIFPTIEVIMAEDGPQKTGYIPEIIEKQNTYLTNLLQGRTINAFYSSEPYGEFVSRAFQCANRMVDIERKEHPISSTMLRNNQIWAKHAVSKCVFDSIKPKLYFLGGPSTGKTTIASYAAEQLQASYCKEYGRDYWFQFQQDHRLTMRDLEIIAREHTALEEAVSKEEKDFVCIDTTTITTLAYAYYYFGTASAQLIQTVTSNLYKYQQIFLCDADIPFDDTWDRSGPGSRAELQAINLDILKRYQLPYTVLSGSVEERFNHVKHVSRERERAKSLQLKGKVE